MKQILAMLRIPAALETPSSDAVRRFWIWAVIVAIAVAAIYISLIVSIDNTNVGTTNGLWKTPWVYDWEHRISEPLDDGGLLYFPLYGHLARLMPDRLAQFGVHATIVTFRKMAILNAIFGGVASGLVFLLALRFACSPWAAMLMVAVHAGAGFVLLNSINSEDIMPGYAFFVAASVCFFEFLYRPRIWLLLAWAFLFACATLLHWTVMVPGMFAFGAAFLVPIWRKKFYIVVGAAGLASFLAIVKLFVSRTNIPLWRAIYPAKASTGGWIGFQPQKLIYCAIGIGNYFSGGRNEGNFRNAFASRSTVESMSISWIFAVVCLAGCVMVLFDRREKVGAKCFAVFALALFVGGQVENLYSQPQDPQMQIQPMFAAIVGMILLVRGQFPATRPSSWTGARRLGAVGMAAALLANGAVNVREMGDNAGGDSRALAGLEELDKLFPHESTTIVSSGFEGWNTWEYVVLWRGDERGYLSRNVQLYRPFTANRGIQAYEAASVARAEIDDAFRSGRQVIAFALWTETPAEFVSGLTTVAAEDQALSYDSVLRKSYSLGRSGRLRIGNYVQLLPLAR